MIDRRPTPGNYTHLIEDDVGLNNLPYNPTPNLHDVPPVRQSSVLGPDGNPLMVDVPRQRIGFVLPHQKRRG